MGTWYWAYKSRAKKYETAPICSTFSGFTGSQELAGKSLRTSTFEMAVGMKKFRICVLFAEAISAEYFSFTRSILMTILDCPAHSQTSPKRTSFRDFSLIVISYGPPAGVAGNVQAQFPLEFPIAWIFFPLKVTFIFSPGFAQPQIFTGMSRCNTIPLLTKEGSLTSEKAAKLSRRKKIFFIEV